MNKYRFKKIDAFTADGSSGNPAGCIYIDIMPDVNDMQKIALQLKGYVNEVVFVQDLRNTGLSKDCDFKLLYYSFDI